MVGPAQKLPTITKSNLWLKQSLKKNRLKSFFAGGVMPKYQKSRTTKQ